MLRDLKGFKEVREIGFLVQYIFEFDNGFGASVVRGLGAYGNVEHPYELAVLKDGELCHRTEITDDVVGFLDKNLVEEFLNEIAKLDKDGKLEV